MAKKKNFHKCFLQLLSYFDFIPIFNCLIFIAAVLFGARNHRNTSKEWQLYFFFHFSKRAQSETNPPQRCMLRRAQLLTADDALHKNNKALDSWPPCLRHNNRVRWRIIFNPRHGDLVNSFVTNCINCVISLRCDSEQTVTVTKARQPNGIRPKKARQQMMRYGYIDAWYEPIRVCGITLKEMSTTKKIKSRVTVANIEHI